jgi:hypothetical protein
MTEKTTAQHRHQTSREMLSKPNFKYITYEHHVYQMDKVVYVTLTAPIRTTPSASARMK